MLFFCQRVWFGETLEKKKQKKSRTRTYGPLSPLRLSKEADIKNFSGKKMGAAKKSESLKTLTQLGDLRKEKSVHKMFT